MRSDAAGPNPGESSRIAELKAEIRDLGDRVDSYKARTAGAIGGAVFLLLLGVGGAYDLINGNQSISIATGLSHDAFKWAVITLVSAGVFLAIVALRRESKRDRSIESRLARLEQELADLLEESASGQMGS